MRFVEVLRQPQNAPEKVSADLDRRFADAAGEGRRFFDDQDAQGGMLAQEQQGRRCAGKRAPNNGNVVPFAGDGFRIHSPII